MRYHVLILFTVVLLLVLTSCILPARERQLSPVEQCASACSNGHDMMSVHRMKSFKDGICECE